MRVKASLVRGSHVAALAPLAIASAMLLASGAAMPVRAETADAVTHSPATPPATAVTNWNRIATTILAAFPPPAGGAPPALQVNLAVPERIPFPNQATLLESLDTEYDASLAEIPDGPSRTEGIAAGNAGAEAMIGAREDDGRGRGRGDQLLERQVLLELPAALAGYPRSRS